MSNRPSPPYPSADELKATRAIAIVAFVFAIVVIVVLVVMLTLQIAQVADFGAATFLAVIFGGALVFLLIVSFGGRKHVRRKRAETLFSSEEQASIDRVVNRIKHQRGHNV
ncbi:hypothetical protein ACWGOE_04260 [Leucobacter chromiiresistens]